MKKRFINIKVFQWKRNEGVWWGSPTIKEWFSQEEEEAEICQPGGSTVQTKIDQSEEELTISQG